MSDRLLVQNSVPVVDVVLPDGTTMPGVAITGNFDWDQGLIDSRIIPAVSTSVTYTSGDCVGGKLTFPDVAPDTDHLGIIVDSLIVVDLSQKHHALDLVLFDRDFTGGTDNSPFDPTDADLLNCIGVVQVSTYVDFVDNSVATLKDIKLPCVLNDLSLFGQLVTRSALTAFAGAADLQLSLRTRRA